jgi:hypothetical protein
MEKEDQVYKDLIIGLATSMGFKEYVVSYHSFILKDNDGVEVFTIDFGGSWTWESRFNYVNYSLISMAGEYLRYIHKQNKEDKNFNQNSLYTKPYSLIK